MKIIIITALVLLATFAIWQVVLSKSTNKTNRVAYKTISVQNGYEIREYSEQVVASTQLDSSAYSKIASQGFRRIASYIFGGNSNSQTIAMTSPVQMEMGPNPTMSFFMPSDLSTSDLPTPNLKDVYLNVQPSKIVAVIDFPGWASDEVLNAKFNELKSQLDASSMDYENSFSYLGYNPPYQMLNRKNEVIIPLTNYNK